jgi:hypothetical protein
MEANLKETQLTFSKGMTNVPSDNLCDDNTLADGYGLRVKDGELKAVRSAKAFDSAKLPGLLVYAHKVSSGDNLIYEEGGALQWATHDEDSLFLDGADVGIDVGSNFGDGKGKITSIGNTLIVATDSGLKYALWKKSKYEPIGSMPSLEVSVSEVGDDIMLLPSEYTPDKKKDIATTIYEAYQLSNDAANTSEEKYQKISNAKDEIIGLIEASNKAALTNKLFVYPFWVRVALRLKDGSYTMISNPVLALPSIRHGGFVSIIYEISNNSFAYVNLGSSVGARVNITIHSSNFAKELKDIIDKIVVFISDPVKTWKDKDTEDVLEGSIADELVSGTYEKHGHGMPAGTWTNALYIMPPYQLSDTEIIEKLIQSSVFYKVAEIEYTEGAINHTFNLSHLIKDGVLENLTTQEQLPNDDYYNHCTLQPYAIYTFNNRLQIANINRIPFEGFAHFTGRENNDSTLTAYVEIEGSDGTMTVSRTIGSYGSEIPFYFYYPDPNAKEVVFKEGESVVASRTLQKHPRLNGAYYFAMLPNSNTVSVPSDTSDSITYATGSEQLQSQVMTSEVNNPWVFNAEGDNTVGTGAIIGVCANTIALSQGQFGQHPLIVFTNEGIYALGTNSEGLYNTAYPLSREVCNNAKSITPTDGAIFFTSEKGLMMMVGSQITCVTEQLSGKTFSKDDALKGAAQNGKDTLLSDVLGSGEPSFNEYIASCMIAYDYKEKCLLLINSSKNYYYVYDIASHAVTRCNQMGYQRVVNDYPDNLLQGTDGTVYTLLNKGDANDDTNTYDGMLLSRPCKFGNAQALKSLRQILHVKDLNDNATIELHIYVSNDLKHWGEIHSLRGSGYKYFRFGMKFTGLKATDSYSGMLVLSQTRRTDKLR